MQQEKVCLFCFHNPNTQLHFFYRRNHIDTGNFGDDALEGIKYFTKSTSRLNNPTLQDLFNEINRKNENVIVRKLVGWVKILKEKNYQVDINELKNV